MIVRNALNDRKEIIAVVGRRRSLIVTNSFFNKIITNTSHILQQFISDRITNYTFRTRSHNKTLIPKTSYLNDRNFLIRNLYKDCVQERRIGLECDSFITVGLFFVVYMLCFIFVFTIFFITALHIVL